MGKEENISLIPALDDPEKAKEFKELREKRDIADYMCYTVLKELLRKIGEERLKKAFMTATEFGKKEAEIFIEEIENVLEKREKYNEAMLNIIAGR